MIQEKYAKTSPVINRKVIELEGCHTKYSKTSSLSNAEGEITSKTLELAFRPERNYASFQSVEVVKVYAKN